MIILLVLLWIVATIILVRIFQYCGEYEEPIGKESADRQLNQRNVVRIPRILDNRLRHHWPNVPQRIVKAYRQLQHSSIICRIGMDVSRFLYMSIQFIHNDPSLRTLCKISRICLTGGWTVFQPRTFGKF